jgi:hypothetical protein
MRPLRLRARSTTGAHRVAERIGGVGRQFVKSRSAALHGSLTGADPRAAHLAVRARAPAAVPRGGHGRDGVPVLPRSASSPRPPARHRGGRSRAHPRTHSTSSRPPTDPGHDPFVPAGAGELLPPFEEPEPLGPGIEKVCPQSSGNTAPRSGTSDAAPSGAAPRPTSPSTPQTKFPPPAAPPPPPPAVPLPPPTAHTSQRQQAVAKSRVRHTHAQGRASARGRWSRPWRIAAAPPPSDEPR